MGLGRWLHAIQVIGGWPRAIGTWARRIGQQAVQAAAPGKASGTTHEALLRGYTHIPNVVIARWVSKKARPHNLWLLYLVLISEWPLYLNLVLVLIHRQWAATKGYAMLWIGGFGLSVALMLVAAMVAWSFATDRGYLFDDIISKSPERQAIPAWSDRFMNFRRQLIVPILGALGGPTYLYMLRGDIGRVVGIGFPSYILLSWVSFVGGVDVYWLWVATGLPKKIYKCTNLSLRWQDPGSTPGLRLLSDSYGISGLFLLAGLISISITGFLLPRDLSSTIFLYTLFAFFAIVFFTSIRVVIVPLVWLWLIIVRAKRSLMATLNSGFPDPSQMVKQGNYESIGSLASIYQIVSEASTLPFGTGALVQYFAALASSVFAFFFGLITSQH